jgi:hypothetical protein
MKISRIYLLIVLAHCASTSYLTAEKNEKRKNPIVSGLSGAVAAVLAPVRITTEAVSYVGEAANTVAKRMYNAVKFDPQTGDFNRMVYIGGYLVPLVVTATYAYYANKGKSSTKIWPWVFPTLIAAGGIYDAAIGYEH